MTALLVNSFFASQHEFSYLLSGGFYIVIKAAYFLTSHNSYVWYLFSFLELCKIIFIVININLFLESHHLCGFMFGGNLPLTNPTIIKFPSTSSSSLSSLSSSLSKSSSRSGPGSQFPSMVQDQIAQKVIKVKGIPIDIFHFIVIIFMLIVIILIIMLIRITILMVLNIIKIMTMILIMIIIMIMSIRIVILMILITMLIMIMIIVILIIILIRIVILNDILYFIILIIRLILIMNWSLSLSRQSTKFEYHQVENRHVKTFKTFLNISSSQPHLNKLSEKKSKQICFRFGELGKKCLPI